MITQIDLHIYRCDSDHRFTEDKSSHSISLPYISAGAIGYIYNIILDKDAELIMAYDKQDPRSIIRTGIDFGLSPVIVKHQVKIINNIKTHSTTQE